MKTKFYFFHGYGSGINSSKFIMLKEHFGESFEMKNEVWRLNDNIGKILSRVYDELEYEENPILFGDSTGANFAYQLREQRLNKGKKTILIMSAPLLDFSKRISKMEFDENIQQYLIKITQPNNAMLIIPTRDEVLDQSMFLAKNNFKNLKILTLNDTHRLQKLKVGVGIEEIKKYIAEHNK